MTEPSSVGERRPPLTPAQKRANHRRYVAHCKANPDDPLYRQICKIVAERSPAARAKLGAPKYPGILDLTLGEVALLEAIWKASAADPSADLDACYERATEDILRQLLQRRLQS
jgi:hypothetical protein